MLERCRGVGGTSGRGCRSCRTLLKCRFKCAMKKPTPHAARPMAAGRCDKACVCRYHRHITVQSSQQHVRASINTDSDHDQCHDVCLHSRLRVVHRDAMCTASSLRPCYGSNKSFKCLSLQCLASGCCLPNRFPSMVVYHSNAAPPHSREVLIVCMHP